MTIRITNWDKWQTYRSDRGQPPWIKVHRSLMRNPEWVTLTDAQRGQLVGMWLLAADQDGVIPASPSMIQKLCYMDSEPDLQVFVSLGFMETDANLTPTRRQRDRTETEEETEKETETEARSARVKKKKSGKKKETDPTVDDAWARVRDLYPSRTGGQGWTEAEQRFRKLCDDGTDPAALVAKVEEYATHVTAEGLAGTSFVMQATSFFGPSKTGYLEDWSPPKVTKSHIVDDDWLARNGF